jgi:hypothetical protein
LNKDNDNKSYKLTRNFTLNNYKPEDSGNSIQNPDSSFEGQGGAELRKKISNNESGGSRSPRGKKPENGILSFKRGNSKILSNDLKEMKQNRPNINENRLDDQECIHHNLSEPNDCDNLFDIIYKLQHNTDLNLLTQTINKILVKDNKKPFNKSDLTIGLKANELDKFSKAKKVHKDFTVNITYSLSE